MAKLVFFVVLADNAALIRLCSFLDGRGAAIGNKLSKGGSCKGFRDHKTLYEKLRGQNEIIRKWADSADNSKWMHLCAMVISMEHVY
ncbi:MAG: hypothetical protein FWG10_01280 [Eubacteriaceae bacterium]|nr:hypothetical protein [Eubacteriaceae bacterium]